MIRFNSNNNGIDKKLTLFIHTANRSEQLYRVLRYYSNFTNKNIFEIIIADGSNDSSIRVFDQLLQKWPIDLSFKIQRYSPNINMVDRIQQAFKAVSTPYFMFTADDDFYFSDWIDEAVNILDKESDIIAVNGNYFYFGLENFTAFSNDINFIDNQKERFALPWLESETAEGRVEEIGKNRNGIQIMNWYALNRTDEIAKIITHSRKYDFSILIFERFFAIAQASLGKTRFTHTISIARQSNADPKDQIWRSEPFSYLNNNKQLTDLKLCTTSFFLKELKSSTHNVEKLVEVAYTNEFNMMKQADRRLFLRKTINFLRIRYIINKIRMMKSYPVRDTRLPRRSDVQELSIKKKIVEKACRVLRSAEN